MSINGGPYAPTTRPAERPTCNRCPKRHPGKNYSESFCRVPVCGCHRRGE